MLMVKKKKTFRTHPNITLAISVSQKQFGSNLLEYIFKQTQKYQDTQKHIKLKEPYSETVAEPHRKPADEDVWNFIEIVFLPQKTPDTHIVKCLC